LAARLLVSAGSERRSKSSSWLKSGQRRYLKSRPTRASEDGMKLMSRIGRVLVEEFLAPTRGGRGEVERGKVAALHPGGGGDAGGGEEGGCEVDVEGELGVRGAAFGDRHAGIPHDERDADALLVRIPFVGEAVLGVEIAVVGSEYD